MGRPSETTSSLCSRTCESRRFVPAPASFARSFTFHHPLARRKDPRSQIPRQGDIPLLGPLADLDRHLLAGLPQPFHERSVELVHRGSGVLAFVGLHQQAAGAAGDVSHLGTTLLNDFPNPVNEILEETDPSVAIRDLSLDDALGKGGTDVRNVRGFCMTWY